MPLIIENSKKELLKSSWLRVHQRKIKLRIAAWITAKSRFSCHRQKLGIVNQNSLTQSHAHFSCFDNWFIVFFSYCEASRRNCFIEIVNISAISLDVYSLSSLANSLHVPLWIGSQSNVSEMDSTNEKKTLFSFKHFSSKKLFPFLSFCWFPLFSSKHTASKRGWGGDFFQHILTW